MRKQDGRGKEMFRKATSSKRKEGQEKINKYSELEMKEQ